MSSIEILTRLNPKVSNMESVGVSSVQGLTSADVAAACARCSPLGYLALKRRVIGDMTLCSGYYELYARIIKLAYKHKWEVRPKCDRIPKFKALLNICLSDYFEISRCKPCKGSGKKATDKAGIIFRTCQACEGTGNKPKNDATRARALGVSRSAYSRNWANRYNQVMNMLNDLLPIEEDRAIREVNKRLRHE